MFRWYEEAEVCYAYLSVVSPSKNALQIYRSFANSNWFNRGWTLQELLAPRRVVFVDEEWQDIGTKASLGPQISSATRISERHLYGDDFRSASIATKMS